MVIFIMTKAREKQNVLIVLGPSLIKVYKSLQKFAKDNKGEKMKKNLSKTSQFIITKR